MNEYRNKMQVLKNDFALLLEDRFNEGIVLHAHRHGLWSLIAEARRISQIPEIKENKAKTEAIFEDEWNKVLDTLSGGAKINEV